MRNLYIRYNEITGSYALSEGQTYESRRKVWDAIEDDLGDKLKSIDSKRKTDLYLKEIPVDILGKITQLFNGTKVTIKNLENKIKK